jgi:hypothetical protein
MLATLVAGVRYFVRVSTAQRNVAHMPSSGPRNDDGQSSDLQGDQRPETLMAGGMERPYRRGNWRGGRDSNPRPPT